MSTTTVSLEITCPSWCVVDPGEHGSELWDNGGECFHRGKELPVIDTTGYQRALEEPTYHDPIHVQLVTVTSPENRETASPVLEVERYSLSIDQALALADEIRRQVEQYRAAGGVA